MGGEGNPENGRLSQGGNGGVVLWTAEENGAGENGQRKLGEKRKLKRREEKTILRWGSLSNGRGSPHQNGCGKRKKEGDDEPGTPSPRGPRILPFCAVPFQNLGRTGGKTQKSYQTIRLPLQKKTCHQKGPLQETYQAKYLAKGPPVPGIITTKPQKA